MIHVGCAPYLECSSRGDRRFSAFYARPKSLNGRSIEEAYQAAKLFEDGRAGLSWREAKGKKAINQDQLAGFYYGWWEEYLYQNPGLFEVMARYGGFSDMFGQPGHLCQAIVLWSLYKDYQALEDDKT